MNPKELVHRYRPMTVILAVALVAVAAFVAGRFTVDRPARIAEDDIVIDTGVETVWTCSMHPQIRQPEPGQCPICGMDLIPVETTGAAAERAPRQIALSPYAEKLAEIRTEKAVRRYVDHELTVLGEVAHDETQIKYITSWVPGRIDRLYVNSTGVTVNSGDRLADIYSPAVYAAQEEYLQALETARELAGSALPSTRETAALTVTAAREKLRLLGLTESQIDNVRERGTPDEHVTIHSTIDGVVTERAATSGMYVETGSRIYTVVDLSTVWIELELFESDLPWVMPGQDVTFTTGSYPGETFTGRVAFIDPEVDSRTRTIDVRVEVPNPDEKLKPDMFVDGTISATSAGEQSVLAADAQSAGGEPPLVIPRTAPLITGERAVVYVAVQGQPGVYEGREVVLGPRAGDYYLVREGLAEGDEVVVNGNFKIDSALQILAKPSMMNPEGGVSMTAHNHGGMSGGGGMEEMEDTGHDGQSMPSAGQSRDVSREVPTAFMGQLSGVYDTYFTIREALADDSLDAANRAGDELLDALNGVDMSLLGHDAHQVWMTLQADIDARAHVIAEAADLDAAREAFAPLSNAIIRVAQQFGHTGDAVLYQFHCPMAFDNAGADWLQREPELQNPYFGASMLTCGSLVETYQGTGNE